MGADDITRVRDRISAEHADFRHGVDGLDTIEATSLVRSALAIGISPRDIGAAIRASRSLLSAAEERLLTEALADAPRGVLASVPPPFGLPFSGRATLTDRTGATTSVAYSGINVTPRPNCVGVLMHLTEVSGTNQTVRATAFDCTLARAYGLDPELCRRSGTPEQEVFTRVLATPEIAAARAAYLDSRTPLAAGESCLIPLPMLVTE